VAAIVADQMQHNATLFQQNYHLIALSWTIGAGNGRLHCIVDVSEGRDVLEHAAIALV
jgi:hypothetical protein